MKQYIKSHRVAIGCSIGCAIGVALVLVIGLYLLLKPVDVDRQNHSDVARTFAYSLLDNNVTVAKSLATPEQWERIDAWMAKHPPFSCPFSWDIEGETDSGSSIVPKDEDITATVHFRYQCVEEDYNFSIDDIILERTDEGWLVADWSRVCESWDWGYTLKCE
jgi:hypothetical protein